MEDSVQFSCTRIGTDTFRIIAQSEKKILATWIVERKNLERRLLYEVSKLRILTTELDECLEKESGF